VARESVREGEGLAKPLKASGAFPPIVTHMIAIGERSGQLEEMLENVAAAYDQQIEVRVQAMTAHARAAHHRVHGHGIGWNRVLHLDAAHADLGVRPVKAGDTHVA
jgi:hypothetical protein